MNVDLDELREKLRERKHDEGVSHVKSKHLAERMDYTPSELGAALSELEEKGEVESIGYVKATTYKVMI